MLLSQFSAGCGWQRPDLKPLQLTAPGITIDGHTAAEMTQDEVADLVFSLAHKHTIPPQDAGFDPDTGRIVPEKNGRYLDIQATTAAALSAPAGTAVPLVYGVVSPSITFAAVKNSQLLGAFTTKILDSHPARVHNIRLAAGLINNALLEPGYEFSFNKRVGEPTVERGFQPARIFGDGGQVEEGIGGGICQVSSTLYNAALAAEMKITERHPHSQPVTYVPPGKDATTFTDKDLRFLNSTRRRIIIRSWLTTDGLVVDMWGLPPSH